MGRMKEAAILAEDMRTWTDTELAHAAFWGEPVTQLAARNVMHDRALDEFDLEVETPKERAANGADESNKENKMETIENPTVADVLKEFEGAGINLNEREKDVVTLTLARGRALGVAQLIEAIQQEVDLEAETVPVEGVGAAIEAVAGEVGMGQMLANLIITPSLAEGGLPVESDEAVDPLDAIFAL